MGRPAQLEEPLTNALPDQSSGSLLRGLWFVFPIEGAKIRAWGSCLSGAERVYRDQELVSEGRNLGKASGHTFASGGHEYEIQFNVISMLKAHLECTLTKEGKPLAVASSRYQYRLLSWLKGFIIMVAAGAVVGTIAGLLEVPWIFMVVVLAPVLLLVGRRYAGRFEFTEADPPALDPGVQER